MLPKNQNAISTRDRDILAQKFPEKGNGATSKEDSIKSAIQSKPKPKKTSKYTKHKKKKRNAKIKFVDTS